MLWFVPPAIIAALGLGKLIYDAVTDDDEPSPRPYKKDDVVFLTGETGVGKDTILEILENARFKEETISTTMPRKTYIYSRGSRVEIWNTGGSEAQVGINANTKEKLAEQIQQYGNIYYVYVFDASKYFDHRDLIKNRLNSAKKFAQMANFKLKIIGTHRDKAQKHETKMNDLMNEFRQNYGECEIWDLTRARVNGEQVKNELVDFIFEG